MNRLIPFARKEGGFDIFVILSQESLTRLADQDPCVVEIKKLGHPWNTLKLNDIHFMFANDEELAQLDAIKSGAEMLEAIRLLGRGWKYRPELGDDNAPYQSRNQERN